jgi:Raf kinase inhibitor-like YbhB/YbcL family protein
MLEKTPAVLGRALHGVRAGADHLIWAKTDAPETLVVASPAFTEGGEWPVRFTQDGDKRSPPLTWQGAPDAAAAIAIVIEDADSPTPSPILHAIAMGPASPEGGLETGALSPQADGDSTWIFGKTSFGSDGYLPPDPPRGHGPHRYVIQVFALAERPTLKSGLTKQALMEALEAGVLARGRLEAVYERAA